MRQRRGFVATTFMFALLLPAGVAWAGSSEVQDLKREVARLRAEVQTLQTAMNESAELDRRQYAKISKALDSETATAEPASQPADAPATRPEPAIAAREPAPPTAPAAAAATPEKKSAGASRHRHRRARHSR